MYWTNWNAKRPSIQRSTMGGQDVTTLISKAIGIVNGLVIDHTEQKLYWHDAKLDKIERCNMDGSERKTIYTSVSHPFGLALFGR